MLYRFARELENLCTVYKKQYGETIHPYHSIIVGTDGALNLLRELAIKVHPKITFNVDDDVLFNFDGAPVRMRHHAPPGRAIVMAHVDVPARRCCDQAAMQAIMLALSRGQA